MEQKESSFSYYWQMAIFGLIALSAFEIPISYSLRIESNTLTMGLDLIVSLLFAVDLYISTFRKDLLPVDPFTHKLILESDSTHQLNFWILVSVLSIIPFETINTFFFLHPMIPLLGLIRVLRMVKVFKILMIWDTTANLSKSLKLTFTFIGIILFINFVSCLWLSIQPPQNGIVETSDYIMALYWTVTTLTTVGYGDITPETNTARLFTICVMIMGIGLFGLTIGYVSQALFLADKHKEAQRKKLSDLALFMNYYSIPRPLKKQVFSFYHHMLNQHFTENDKNILMELPTSLQKEITTFMNIRLIKDVPIFNNCGLNCLKAIAESLDHIYCSPNEAIINAGEPGEEFYIIGHGQVEVTTPNGNILTTLKDRQSFGEIALIKEITRTANVKATTYCDLYKLSKASFLAVVHEFPELLKNIEGMLTKRSNDKKNSTTKKVA